MNHKHLRMRIAVMTGFAMALCCTANTSASGKRAADKTTANKLTVFFEQSLRQQDKAVIDGREAFINYQWNQPDLPINAPLKIKAINRMSALTWEAWRQANKRVAASDKAGLPSLDPLAESQGAAWTLPASLEPDATMNFYWGRKNDTADTTHTSLPLFLYLHGSGPRDNEWATGKRLALWFDDAPSVYFIPRIPNEGAYYRWWQLAKQYAWERLLRLALCDPAIDPNRVYVFGISEGGYGSQRLAAFYADYWAAAGPMAGGEPLRNAPPENCANIGFSLLTGELDKGFYRNILTQRAKETFDSLQQIASMNGDSLFIHHIELQKGRGHGIDYSPDTPWLKTFRRNPWPKHVRWEDFAMDGRHRRAFYNISVEKRPAGGDDARTAYTMDIAGDTIRLAISNVAYNVVERDPTWGIELKTTKQYSPATGGKIKIFLNRELVRIDKKVVVLVNGTVRFAGKPSVNMGNLAESCLLWGDPCRLFPAAITITY